jgi:hypothetical protein
MKSLPCRQLPQTPVRLAPPPKERFRSTAWDKDGTVFTPHTFGWGYGVNVRTLWKCPTGDRPDPEAQRRLHQAWGRMERRSKCCATIAVRQFGTRRTLPGNRDRRPDSPQHDVGRAGRRPCVPWHT